MRVAVKEMQGSYIHREPTKDNEDLSVELRKRERERERERERDDHLLYFRGNDCTGLVPAV